MQIAAATGFSYVVADGIDFSAIAYRPSESGIVDREEEADVVVVSIRDLYLSLFHLNTGRNAAYEASISSGAVYEICVSKGRQSLWSSHTACCGGLQDTKVHTITSAR